MHLRKMKYSKETATILANQLLVNATSETNIAIISAPSAFVQLKNILVGHHVISHAQY